MSERKNEELERIESMYDARYLALELVYRQLSDSIRQNKITAEDFADVEELRDSLHRERDQPYHFFDPK